MTNWQEKHLEEYGYGGEEVTTHFKSVEEAIKALSYFEVLRRLNLHDTFKDEAIKVMVEEHEVVKRLRKENARLLAKLKTGNKREYEKEKQRSGCAGKTGRYCPKEKS